MVTKTKEIDPRVKRTRQLLQQAFGQLLAEKSFRAISVQDIAERATVNRATFYAHFPDKFALLESFIREGFQQLLSSKLSESSSFNLSNLRLLILTVCEHFAWLQDHCKPADREFEPLHDRAVQQELYEFILAWLRPLPPAEAPSRATRETAATIMSWAIFGAGDQWGRGPRTLTAEQLTAQVVAVLSGGLSQAVKAPFLERHEQASRS